MKIYWFQIFVLLNSLFLIGCTQVSTTEREASIPTIHEKSSDKEATKHSFINKIKEQKAIRSPASDGYWWWKLNGARMFYLQIHDNTFTDITSQLDDLYHRGYRIVSLFTVYNGDPDAYAGLGPIDFYQPAPQAGTMEEFEAFIEAAHQRGMKISSWINLGYVSPKSKYWEKAQKDKKADIDSEERNSFIWSDRAKVEKQDLCGWEYSEIAQCYYKKSWGYPAFNWNSRQWRERSENILEFWMDKGIDAWIIDAWSTMEESWCGNFPRDLLKQCIADTIAEKGGIAAAEGSGGGDIESSFDRGLYFVYDNNGSSLWHDETNIAWEAIFSQDASKIEGHILNKADVVRSMGGITISYDPGEGDKHVPYQIQCDDPRRVLEIALMTSVGVIYEMWAYCQPPLGYGPTTLGMEEVLRTVNSNSALEPGGIRKYLDNDQQSVYSIIKTSIDGQESVLCIFNFADSETKVTIDLSESKVVLGQTPMDLISRQRSPQILSYSYTLTLPAYGFTLYRIDIEQ